MISTRTRLSLFTTSEPLLSFFLVSSPYLWEGSNSRADWLPLFPRVERRRRKGGFEPRGFSPRRYRAASKRNVLPARGLEPGVYIQGSNTGERLCISESPLFFFFLVSLSFTPPPPAKVRPRGLTGSHHFRAWKEGERGKSGFEPRGFFVPQRYSKLPGGGNLERARDLGHLIRTCIRSVRLW